MKDGKQRIDKDGDPVYRRIIDYRQLNNITIKNGYPLTLITTMKENISKAKWFTALNLREGYHLIRMAKGEEWKTAFRTIHKHYEYKVMPFGLTNAPASFQNMVMTTLRQFLDQFVFVYLDDILIYSKTLKEHKKHMAMVLEALEKANLLVNADKSIWHIQKLDFLGFTLTPGQIQIQRSKLEAVKDWPIPNKATITNIRQILGFTGYVRSLVKKYGDIVRPLTKLTTKNGPIVRMPNPDKKKRLKTDASDYALGAVLEQLKDNGKWYPVAYYSKALRDAELRYQIYDKELLAIINALKEWEPFLSGTKEPFDIYSDHKNLTRFMKAQELNKRYERWIIFLSKFNFKIHHIKGKENIQADILSRRGDYDSKNPKRNLQMLQYNQDGIMQLCEIVKKPTPELLTRFRNSYDVEEQQEVQQLKGQPEDQLLYHGKIYVPKGQQKQFVKEFHENPLHGHQGIFKTTKRLQEKYDFPELHRIVKIVVKNCNICNKAKAARHKPYGLLQPTDIPNKTWNTIAWDFITNLPPSKDPVTGVEYDGVWVIVDRFTKYGYFLPFKGNATAEQLAYAFIRNYMDKHGVPEKVISDRDKLFTSKFGTSFFKQIGVKLKFSTAYHPQTDGQTERLNQTLE
ncbi:hypothetical protein DL765_009529 [Monosporascus sp. GIB2]|nr:hypothetical protein DL765_009529 [Monosporascus sp. GIB2]